MNVWIAPTMMFLLCIFMAYALDRKERNISKERDDMWHERANWAQERKQLMDRIQAGSFAEYKTAEIKMIKAQQPEKETVHLEPQ